MKFELNLLNRNISNDEYINDVRRVANLLGLNSLGHEQYDEYSYRPIANRFGSWNKALEAAGLNIGRYRKIDDKELFKNIEEIWIKLGRQPLHDEINKNISKYSIGAYRNRFGSWSKVLEAFIKYINSEEEIFEIEKENPLNHVNQINKNSPIKHQTNRSINWRLRFLVMRRDNFKCKICGKSPSTNPTVELHVDHIKPWSKGGESTLDNLQTLCSKCNIGESDL
jgi:hypothetical protein